MNAIIRAEADARGFAYFALSALYEQANTKAPFSAITLAEAAGGALLAMLLRQ